MHDMTENEKREILKACREMADLKGYIATIQTQQEKLELKNEYLKEKIDEEVKERKEDMKEFKMQMDKKFDGINKILTELGNAVTGALAKMNMNIIKGLSAVLALTAAGFASFWVARTLGIY